MSLARQVEFSREQGIIALSWTMIKNKIFGDNSNSVSIDALNYGKEKHEEIQSMGLGYAELTPFTLYTIKGKKYFLVGHIDIVNFQKGIIYEIKSQRYYQEHKDLVLLQGAYYIFLLEHSMKRQGIKMKFDLCIITYQGRDLQYIKVLRKDMEVYIKQVKHLLSIIVDGKGDRHE